MRLKDKFGVDVAVLVPAEDKWRTLAATQTDLFCLSPAFLNKIVRHWPDGNGSRMPPTDGITFTISGAYRLFR